MFKRRLMACFCILFIVCSFMSLPAFALGGSFSSPAQNEKNEDTTEGMVVSTSRTTVLVRSEDNQFHLFTFDQNTAKPRTLPVGTHVRVVSVQGDEANARQATSIVVLNQAHGATSTPGTSAAPVPPSVKTAENQIRHEARRWRLGVRGGVTLDPELVMFGVHSQMGPIFSRNVFFRPNADFSFGEVTDMIALNLEAVYRFPTPSRREWATYVGAGPSLNFIHQSFQTSSGQGRQISFGNFDYETGFNILMGLQNRSNTFFEVKTSLWASPAPVLRLIVGHSF